MSAESSPDALTFLCQSTGRAYVFLCQSTMESVPHARIAPDFLASNAQAHHDILYAVADLLDNSYWRYSACYSWRVPFVHS